MKNTKVVNLGKVRCLLAELERVRQCILSERISGFYTSLMDEDGRETVFLGGVHKQNARVALKSTLKVSAARALNEDEPLEFPEFASSRF